MLIEPCPQKPPDISEPEFLRGSMPHQQKKIDPELLDVILTTLNGISQIATLGIAWKSYVLQRSEHQQSYDRAQIRHIVRELERHFEILFDSLEEIMQLFSEIEQRDPASITGHEMRFGKSSMILTSSEYSAYWNNMSLLQNSVTTIRAHCGGMTQNLSHMRAQGENSISDFLTDFHDKLNDILFNSDYVEEAAAKIRRLKPRIERFLDQAKSLGN